MINKAKAFAEIAHRGQKYGDMPYMYHVESVVDILKPYGEMAQVIGYLHDVVEDTDVTIDTISEEFGEYVATCVGFLTDEPGNSRKERKEKTHAKLSCVGNEYQVVLIVKVGDRLGNVRESSKNNPGILSMYRREYDSFRNAVYRTNLCDELFNELDRLLK